MDNVKTSVSKINDLLACGDLSASKKELAIGLKKPYQIDLLIIATDIYRASGDREKSLKYANF